MKAINGYLSGLAIGIAMLAGVAVVAPSAIAEAVAADTFSEAPARIIS